MSEDGGVTINATENMAPSASNRLAETIADAYTFIKSAEVNGSLSNISLDMLIGDQILRNGESSKSAEKKYDPYSYDPAKKEPASSTPAISSNFGGGSDTKRPTKMDRLTAIINALSATITEIKGMSPPDVATATEYADAAGAAVSSEDA